MKNEILQGLRAPEKYIDQKYLYDDTGSEIFALVSNLDAYYLNDAETEIFEGRDIIGLLHPGPEGVDIVELGPGDGHKTVILLKKLKEQGIEYCYRPVDISSEAIEMLKRNIASEIEGVSFIPHIGTYEEELKNIHETCSRPKVILFLGATIGNMSTTEVREFLGHMSTAMKSSDKALIGVDLKKSPGEILAAYKHDLAIEFNKNVLHRFNVELKANFDLEKFKHWPSYNPETGTCTHYLVSTAAQKVTIGEQQIIFSQWETIRTISSKKYNHKEINQLMALSGLQVRDYVTDDKNRFAEYVIEKATY